MKIAVTRWSSRVAPLFDTAREILLVDIVAKKIVKRVEIEISGIRPFSRAVFLHELGVEVLLCGGISEFILRQLHALNIEVVPWAFGDVEGVINAYLRGLSAVKK
ncbi:MAG: hypothetical protein K6U74_15945 [Firmicutes bacterium]|nr:hypothetical protein [Bacillota bacterium]